MQIELFEEFVTLAEELNYHAAARRLNTTQSTLSKHVAALEREYGVRLFNRDKTGVALTSKGAILLQSAKAIRDEYALSKALFANGEGKTALFVTGELDSPGVYGVVSETVSLFSLRCPGTIIHFFSSASTAIDAQLALLKDGEADCVVFNLDRRALGRRDDAGRFESRLVCRVPVDAMMSVAHPLASNEELRLTDLAGCTFVRLVGPRYTPSWQVLERQLKSSGIPYLTTPVAASSPYDFMTANLGNSVILMPRAVSAGQDQPGTMRVPISRDNLSLSIYAVYLKENESEQIDAFVSSLAESYAAACGVAVEQR